MRPLHAVVTDARGRRLRGRDPDLERRLGDVDDDADERGPLPRRRAGHSLYLFDKDEDGESYCTGACAAVWPPVETDSTPRAATGVASGALGTVERDDGDRQVTYHGHPLYYYAADASMPGRTKGEEADQFGAEWYLVGPLGKALEAMTSESKPGSDSNDGGGGYP